MPGERPSRRSTWRRRAVSIPAVVVALVVLLPLSPLLLPLLAVVDLVRFRRLPTTRLALFGLWYLAWEVVAVLSCAGLWLVTGFGAGVRRPWSQRAHQRLQSTWVRSLLGVARPLLGLRLEVTGDEVMADGPLVVLCRHTSLMDTLLPAHLLMSRGFAVRYVLKDELLWDPALDLVGHRLPNCFVDRSGTNTTAELGALTDLAATAGPTDALVIFPEGTRWTAAKRAKVQERLAATDPELAAAVAGRTRTMPPRAGGTVALLEGAPDADVVTFTYVGLDGLAGPREAVAGVPLRAPVEVAVWRTPRGEVPGDVDGRRRWLLDEWGRVDAWVQERPVRPARRGGGGPSRP